MEENNNAEWHFQGSIWEFAKMVRYALVFRQLISENRISDWSEIGSNEEKLKEAADMYGMTLRNIAKEMKEISKQLDTAYAMIDLRRRSGLEVSEIE